MSQEDAVDRVFNMIGEHYMPAKMSYPGAPEPEPKLRSRSLGADRVAILLTAARLQDAERCVTAETVSVYAGQSRSTSGGKMTKLGRTGWLDEIDTPADCRCGRPRTKHYELGV